MKPLLLLYRPAVLIKQVKNYISHHQLSLRINALEHHVGNLLVQRGKTCMATHQGTLLLNHLQQAHLLEANLLKNIATTIAP